MSITAAVLLALLVLAVAGVVAATVSVVRGDGYRAAPHRPGGGGAAWTALDLPSVTYRER